MVYLYKKQQFLGEFKLFGLRSPNGNGKKHSSRDQLDPSLDRVTVMAKIAGIIDTSIKSTHRCRKVLITVTRDVSPKAVGTSSERSAELPTSESRV